MSKVNSDDFSVGQWQANASTQIISASISFIASLLIVASTSKSFLSEKKRSNTNTTASKSNRRFSRLNKKTSPYRRIIFLISVSDILYSLAFVTGPFMAQKTNPQARWGVSDSNAACKVNGLFFTVGASTSLLYYASLCYFYYCKISKRMTDEQFTRTFEKKIHIMIACICIANTCLSFAANTYNTYPTGTFCTNANTPAGCDQQPELYGECDPKVEAYIPYFTYFRILVTIFSVVVMLYSMIRLVHSVLNKDRIYGELPADHTQEQLLKYNLRKQLLRETMSQAIMYTVSWFICQSATIAVAVLIFTGVPHEKFPTVFQIYYSAFIPLNSAFNVFIYTRPAVRHVRRMDPSISRFRAFCMVLKAGGEAPNMEQSSSSTNQQLQQDDEQQDEQQLRQEKRSRKVYYQVCHPDQAFDKLQPNGSSREPFGYYYHNCDPSQVLDSLMDENFANLEDEYNEIEERMSGEFELGVRMNVSTFSGPDRTTVHNVDKREPFQFLQVSQLTNETDDCEPRLNLGGENVHMLGRLESNNEDIEADNDCHTVDVSSSEK
ncbi:hypothetical protein CTEN210_06680 [Chaetoceros tenuissimus]|uniref:G-protein coupled receptors family 1 profile domain-containing protein n=1 Tax=Chaetoceros tenuissimus TaxID=426638 RepID=A0AAD3CT84_9STRA|nr:hypothetical protein CTEN210_06680 [Chaetoceros tenuissimus]